MEIKYCKICGKGFGFVRDEKGRLIGDIVRLMQDGAVHQACYERSLSGGKDENYYKRQKN